MEESIKLEPISDRRLFPNAGALQFSIENWSVKENEGPATIAVTRFGGSEGTVGVSYTTSNDSALAGSDYTSTSGTLSWTNGETAPKTFQVHIFNDTIAEAPKTIRLKLKDPTGGAVLDSPANATLTIIDDDQPAARYGLTVDGNPSAGGWPTFNPPPDNDGKYAAGTVVTLTANPSIGYQFSGWAGALSGTANPATITMDGNKFVTANFTTSPSRYLLSLRVNSMGNGSISASPSPDADGKYAPGTVVTLTANPGSGYVFASWGGAASGSSPSTTVTLNRDLAVTANFVNLSGFLPGLRRQIYTNLLGSSIANLTSSPRFPGAPDIVDTVPTLESQYLPNDAGENYGQRLTGWLVPPITGSYVFYLASDDAAQMFLSPDDTAANKQLIVEELGWSP